MITRNFLHIYRVNHHYLKEGELVVAKDVQDAIRKFNEFYEYDIDIFPDGITGVTLEHNLEVVDESDKYED
jgi:hypothetical protein